MRQKLLLAVLTLAIGTLTLNDIPTEVHSETIEIDIEDSYVDKDTMKNSLAMSSIKIVDDFANNEEIKFTVNDFIEEVIEEDKLESKVLAETKPEEIIMPAYPHSTFKAYMQWTATAESSDQYQLALTAEADPETAIMMKNGRYLVAIGFAYGDYVGQEIDIYMESGQYIPAIIGDFKAIEHTDEWQSAAVEKGDILEFVVSSNEDAGIAVNGMGNYDSFFPGYVKEFRKIAE